MKRAISDWLMAWARQSADNRARAFLARETDLTAAIDDYRRRSNSTGAKPTRYAALYEMIVRTRPTCVLECGTGITTIVIAEALKRIGAGRLVSMEDQPAYYESAQRLLPERYRDTVEIRFSPKVEYCHAIFRGVMYRDVPPHPYDLVFVDGPGVLAPSDGQRTADMDLVYQIERAERPVSALIDKRRSSCFVYKALFGERFHYDIVTNLGFLRPSTRENIRDPRAAVSDAFRFTIADHLCAIPRTVGRRPFASTPRD